MNNVPPGGVVIKHPTPFKTQVPMNVAHKLLYGQALHEIRSRLCQKRDTPEIDKFLAIAAVQGSFLNVITVIEDGDVCGYITAVGVSTINEVQRLIGTEACYTLSKVFVQDFSSKTGWRAIKDRLSTVSNADSFANLDNLL